MEGRKACLVLVLVAPLCAGGCGDDDSAPADVAGEYSLSLTNRDNGCQFNDWQEGATSTNIPLTVTQDGSNITGTIGGMGGTFLNLWLGSNVYTGTVSGNHIDMTLYGTNSHTQGNCTYTINSEVAASLSGDVVTGQIRYVTATNGSPECGVLEECVSWQEFNGTRPPR